MKREDSIVHARNGRVSKAAGLKLNGAHNGQVERHRKYTLITGGAGFIGSNVADRLLREGQDVIVYDNLSRRGASTNIEWLTSNHGSHVQVEMGDIRDATRMHSLARHAREVFHFAAQVAVTTSFEDPRADFEINVGGTLNLLEALRSQSSPPPVVFTSTNKVYGSLRDLRVRPNGTRYQPASWSLKFGIDEARQLEFHSPYACSKGAADQYVLDYARSMGLPAVVFRMSCIYGPRQLGTEDQGWIAHFLNRAISGQPLTIYGDGKQVRDVLFITDLVDALLLAQERMSEIVGEAFNIGGGVANTLSLLELLAIIRKLQGILPSINMGKWRAGDQKYYVSDIRKFRALTRWSPRVSMRQGIAELYRWLCEHGGRRDAQGAGELPIHLVRRITSPDQEESLGKCDEARNDERRA
ncbi:MAG: SDR family NAD(P)-dependent oxidoreductase [Deltaproteobacteria bacterium]|nr:SDR family NAD(P)-dependent oxidoreductase [Deltaproteobacteria bacterium]